MWFLRVDLQRVIVVFPHHTHLLFGMSMASSDCGRSDQIFFLRWYITHKSVFKTIIVLMDTSFLFEKMYLE